jgi:hypothetical protein
LGKGKHGSISEEHATWCASATDDDDDGRPWWPNYNSELYKDHMPRIICLSFGHLDEKISLGLTSKINIC